MKKLEKPLQIVCSILGLASIAFFVFDAVVFINLQPKLVRFETISQAEENLFNWVAIGLMVFSAFCLLSLLRTSIYLKNAERISLFSILLIGGGVLSFLFIFADMALLSDIGKQYEFGMEQPEWFILYPVVAFQMLTSVVFTCHHLFGFSKDRQVETITRDSNIFLIVQYVGIICGLMGLATSGPRFLFPGATLPVYIIANLLILVPYVLAVGYWLVTKLKESDRQWVDEKQLLDIGRSALLTLCANGILMVLLFFFNFADLSGIVSLLWFPLYLFSVLLFFSAGNLYFTAKS